MIDRFNVVAGEVDSLTKERLLDVVNEAGYIHKLYERLGFMNAGKKVIGEREYALYDMKID